MQTAVQTQKDVIRRAFEALNNRDRDLFRRLHTEDVVLHETYGDVHGIDALIEHQWGFMEAFPDLRYELEDMIAEGDRLAIRHTATGIHDGELMGIEPTGEEVEVSVMIMFRFEDGNIAEVWLHSNQLSMLEQLGAIEVPGA